jgi:hypothetical protein
MWSSLSVTVREDHSLLMKSVSNASRFSGKTYTYINPVNMHGLRYWAVVLAFQYRIMLAVALVSSR